MNEYEYRTPKIEDPLNYKAMDLYFRLTIDKMAQFKWSNKTKITMIWGDDYRILHSSSKREFFRRF